MDTKKGFSPLETFIVVILIAIFIGVLYSKYQKIETEAKQNIRDNEVRILNLSLELYKTKKGHYPDNITQLFSEEFMDNKTIEFLNLGKRLKDGKYLDPFGKEYIYDKKTGKIIR